MKNFNEKAYWIIGRFDNTFWHVEKHIEIVGESSKKKFSFFLEIESLPKDIIGFYHTHQYTTIPSLQDFKTFTLLQSILDLPLIFLISTRFTKRFYMIKNNSIFPYLAILPKNKVLDQLKQ